MTSFRIRPRFTLHSKKSPLEIQQLIENRLQTHPHDCAGRIIPNHIILKIPPSKQHYWSPQLSLNLEPKNNGTLIRGLYGPHPNVWTLFTFGYATAGILSLFVLITGGAKLSLGKYAFELWALPVFGLVIIILYILSQFGQKLGAEETFTIHHFFEESIQEKIGIQ